MKSLKYNYEWSTVVRQRIIKNWSEICTVQMINTHFIHLFTHDIQSPLPSSIRMGAVVLSYGRIDLPLTEQLQEVIAN